MSDSRHSEVIAKHGISPRHLGAVQVKPQPRRVGRRLDYIAARAEWMARDVPKELRDLVSTVDQESVGQLSIMLLIDLLARETDPSRALELSRDAAALVEDLLLAGDYPGAGAVVRALSRQADDDARATGEPARTALGDLARSGAFHEATQHLGEMDDGAARVFADICTAVGRASIRPLRRRLGPEAEMRRRALSTLPLLKRVANAS